MTGYIRAVRRICSGTEENAALRVRCRDHACSLLDTVVERDITVAVMGCVVNGPGEAREADYGVAGGRGCGLLFKKGEIVRKVPEGELCSALMELIESGEGL